MDKPRRLVRVVLTAGLALAVTFWADSVVRLSAAQLQSAGALNKIDASLLTATANGANASFLILLADQVDLSAAPAVSDQGARGWFVYQMLRSHAERTQSVLRAALDAQGIQYRAFWGANALLVSGGRELVTMLAGRTDVRALESNAPSRWISEPIPGIPVSPAQLPGRAAPNAPEWGVQNVHAPDVWSLGYLGQGIVIGNQDTGMQWDHPALQPQYGGWDGVAADHNYHWHDSIHDSVGNPCGNDSPFPCDDNGHGTHTTGTTSGDDSMGNQIGVAPGAQWMGCRNMDRGVGTPARYIECFEFFMAPTDLSGGNPDPTLRPHVINNSWTCPPSEGCAPNTLQLVVENTQASGILVVASAGNSGSGCESVRDPPAIYDASFSVGAINISNSLAGFSSRGPVTIDGSGRLKPDISAPGVSVRSSVPHDSYGTLSGTSMAGPHVVGSVALLWSAVPALQRQIPDTQAILGQTANPAVDAPNQTCGGIDTTVVPNNSFGSGAVDAFAAVSSQLSPGHLR
jgi:subtilisin family serine protease